MSENKEWEELNKEQPDIARHEELMTQLRQEYPSAALDGAVDASVYTLTRPRLLWLLKEVSDKESGGDLRKFLGDKEELFKYPRWKSTYGLVCKASWGLVNGFKPWGTWATWTDNCEGLVNILHHIAVVNVNKLGGETRANAGKLRKRVEKFGRLALEQIECLAPDIVVSGGAIWLLRSRLPIDSKDFDWSHGTVFRMGSQVWVNAYHPRQSSLTHPQYYRFIVEHVRSEMC